VKRILVILTVLLAFATIAVAQRGKGNQSGQRTLTGQVMTSNDAPVDKAVVYLKNTKTLAIKTFITNPDGNYRFTALSPNIDYEIYAEANGKRSDTKVLSSLDDRPNAVIHLRISH
jgi:protocatechuate 3,4-dioxygenase beta subunit